MRIELFGSAVSKGFGRLESIDTAKGKLRGLGHDAASVDAIMASANWYALIAYAMIAPSGSVGPQLSHTSPDESRDISAFNAVIAN